MELSSGTPNSQDYLKLIRSRRSNSSSPLSFNNTEAETIDISKINFGDDESWLCSTNGPQEVTDVEEWLHNGLSSNSFSPFTSSIDLQKNIDTRTFTRPKKRFTRPSIEQYNDEMYGSSSETITFPMDSKSYVIEEKCEDKIYPTKPSFDLSQPSSSYYFEKMVANSEDVDSFQNMSPPSLVNSMCSSTFATLMESSFIRNDPVLREIRDADYSDSVLLQDLEAPMFQSISESCSSINSDTPENFLKKVSFNANFTRNMSRDVDRLKSMDDGDKNKTVNVTFRRSIEEDSKPTSKTKPDDVDQTYINPNGSPNGTYRRTPKHNNTFKKSDIKKGQHILQSTFEVEPQEELHSNGTHTLIQDCPSIENIKKGLSEQIEMCTDLNRLSYCLENENNKLDVTYNDVNRMTNLKSSKLSSSAGSADSLDRLSSMSSSSRGSNKMLNMADVDAIVEMQERSLQQVMSTPKPAAVTKVMWDNTFISPIVPQEATSDSDLSSTDDYKSVRSSPSSKGSLDNYAKQPPKSVNYIGGPLDTKIKTVQKSAYTMAAPKPVAAVRSQIHNTKINSYSTLKSATSNSNVSKAPHPPVSNLKNMGPRLKGSYTSLRPISANLPVAPPLVGNFNQTTTILPKSGHHNVTHTSENSTRIVEVQPMPREKTIDINDTFVKPALPKTSGLPRPTGIPRPSTGSRIPAPRTSSNIR